MAYTIESVDCDRGLVKVRVREWDGIDRPDYLLLEPLSAAQARGWAERLITSAAGAEMYLADKAKETLAEKRVQLQKLREEVERLEAEVGDA